MPFVKGKSGNPHGRPRYTAVEVIDRELKKRKTDLIEMLFETLDVTIEPVVRLQAIFKLMEFRYAKPKEIELSIEDAVRIIQQHITESRRLGRDAGEALPESTEPPAGI